MVFYSQLAHYTVAKNIFYSGQSLIPPGYCIGFLLKCSCPFQLDQFHSMDPVSPQPHNNIVHLKVFFFIFEKAHVIIKQKQYLYTSGIYKKSNSGYVIALYMYFRNFVNIIVL